MINFVAGMVALWLVHLATDLAVWVSSPSRGHSVVFFGKMRNSRSASLHPGVSMGTGEFSAGDNPAMDLV